MARVSVVVETQNRDLRELLCEGKYVELHVHVHVSGGSLEIVRVLFSREKLNSSVLRIHWAPVSHLKYTEQMSSLISGCGA